MSDNPFRPTRFERHQRPLIWVSPISRQLMNLEGAAYVAGARGSGKTSILKTLDSVEQIVNTTLASQLKFTNMSCLGIYFRATDLFTQSTEGINWQQFAPRTVDPVLLETAFISSLLELTSIRVLVTTLSMLRRRRRIKYSREDATSTVSQLAKLLPSMRDQLSIEFDDPLLQFAALLAQQTETINMALIRGNAKSFLQCTELGQPGSFLQNCAPRLLLLASPPQFRRGDEIRLKVCVDECDYLIHSQQRILNSLVRRSVAPIEWTLAYVDAEYDSTSTIFPNQNLTDADRKVIPLDESEPSDSAGFRRRCQAIISYRLYYSLTTDRQAQLKSRLGDSPIDEIFILPQRMPDLGTNALLHATLAPRASNSRNVQNFLEQAEAFRQKAVLVDRLPETPGSKFVRQTLGRFQYPYYQTLLFERLHLRWEDYLRSAKRRETLASQLRRKEVAAMLMLLQELGIREVPYSGGSIALSLADGCIRDFLEIMAAIYEQWHTVGGGGDIWQFVNKAEPFTVEIQRKGIEQSSLDKFRGIDEGRLTREIVGGQNVAQIFSRVIRAVGHLTRRLQVSEDKISSLKTAERGIFVIDTAAISRLEKMQGIQTGSVLTALRKLEAENLFVSTAHRLGASKTRTDFPAYRFRLHKRFAPMFRYSYRGALEEVRFPDSMLLELIFPRDEFVEELWLKQILDKISSSSEQTDLFESD